MLAMHPHHCRLASDPYQIASLGKGLVLFSRADFVGGGGEEREGVILVVSRR